MQGFALWVLGFDEFVNCLHGLFGIGVAVLGVYIPTYFACWGLLICCLFGFVKLVCYLGVSLWVDCCLFDLDLGCCLCCGMFVGCLFYVLVC